MNDDRAVVAVAIRSPDRARGDEGGRARAQHEHVTAVGTVQRGQDFASRPNHRSMSSPRPGLAWGFTGREAHLERNVLYCKYQYCTPPPGTAGRPSVTAEAVLSFPLRDLLPLPSRWRVRTNPDRAGWHRHRANAARAHLSISTLWIGRDANDKPGLRPPGPERDHRCPFPILPSRFSHPRRKRDQDGHGTDRFRSFARGARILHRG